MVVYSVAVLLVVRELTTAITGDCMFFLAFFSEAKKIGDRFA
jgi:hypothetical protein